MKKLYSFAFYALVTPAITFGTGSVLAQDQNQDSNRLVTETPGSAQGKHPEQLGSKVSSEHQNMRDNKSDMQKQSGMQDKSYMQKRSGYMGSVPVNGMQASNLIGAEVKTTKDENIGPVDDLIIDKDGRIVAIVVGIDGFLGMGEKDVAIGWDDVKRSGGSDGVKKSGDSDEIVLRIDATRESLSTAPKYVKMD